LKQVWATIVSNSEIIPSHHLLCLEAPDIAADADAGQFITIKCGDSLILRRPISIHQVTDSGYLLLFFQVVGQGTLWLSQRQKGERLDLLGPLGNNFTIEPASRNLLLVAGGIGIAPLAFLAQQALKQNKSPRLLLGARTKELLYPTEYLPPGMEVLVTTEDGSYGTKGMATDILYRHLNWADQILACGPKAMYQTIASLMQQQPARRPVQVSLEVRMGCGLGACFSCSIKTRYGMKQVCKDGPVFNLEEILWQEVKI